MAAGEFALIRALLHAAGPVARAYAEVGPGDDCAVLPPTRGKLCVTTDAVVEGVHFSRPAFSPEDVGHKALAVNLSDLAAMGARPTWFTCAVAAPALTPAEARGLGRGMARLAGLHGAALVGGNFTRARELSLTLTAAGVVERGRPLLRGGARPGDVLYVSGELGEARRALDLLLRGEPLRRGDRQRRPVPRVGLGLLARGYARAGMDVSDGFAQDVGHLCRASGVAVEVEVERLPRSRATAALPDGGRALVLGGGEDYELLLAVAPARAAAFERACAAAGERVTAVGHFRRGRGVVLRERGKWLAAVAGHDHFGV
ncbi:MAG: thiamine-monophosphate kinase [Pseudomonadota bacterium]